MGTPGRPDEAAEVTKTAARPCQPPRCRILRSAARRRGRRMVYQEKVDFSWRIRYVIELNEPFPLAIGAAERAAPGGSA
jgi:hypothetical protein